MKKLISEIMSEKGRKGGKGARRRPPRGLPEDRTGYADMPAYLSAFRNTATFRNSAFTIVIGSSQTRSPALVDSREYLAGAARAARLTFRHLALHLAANDGAR
jgi:hypothetical protein